MEAPQTLNVKSKLNMKFTSVEFFKTPEISAENEFMRVRCESQLNVKSKSVEFFKRPETAAEN